MKGIKLFLLIIGCLCIFSAASADTITIVADNWAPYNGDPDSSSPGYGIEIAQRAFKDDGHTVVYKVIPWSDAVDQTREGKYTAIIGAFKEDAPDFVFPEEEFGTSKNTFFVRKGFDWRYTGPGSINKVRIGLIKDYSYGDTLDKLFARHDKIVFAEGEDALPNLMKKLLLGEIDVIIEDPNVFFFKTVEMKNGKMFQNAGDTGKPSELYIAFSPNNPKSKEYAEILSKGIKNLKESGELEKILAKYGLKYWK